jgi:putative membrane protein
MLADLYLWFKVFHIISMVSWMAGLFYLPRIFVYHAEQGTVGSAQSEIFKVMEYKLMRFIMIPSMVSTWLFGLVLCFIPGVLEITTDYWFYIKGFFCLNFNLVHFLVLY